MKTSKTLRILLLLLSITGIYAVWYDWRYSMDVAEEYEVNEPTAAHSLLIATQGSEYKDKVTSAIVSRLSDTDTYIRVIDVGQLAYVDTDPYTAVVLIHTIQMWKAPQSVVDFVDHADNTKVYALATSGDGSYHIEGVDGMTSASPTMDADKHASAIAHWFETKYLS